MVGGRHHDVGDVAFQSPGVSLVLYGCRIRSRVVAGLLSGCIVGVLRAMFIGCASDEHD